MCEHDLADEMMACEWFRAKVCRTDSYAQNLYSALCNMQWQKIEVMPILKDELWSCSWRGAGRIVSELRDQGDYMDWYCSGIMTQGEYTPGYVPEGTVTDEIRADLLTLLWQPVEWPSEIV